MIIQELKPNQPVKYNGIEYIVISCDMGGKCKLKKSNLPNKGKIIKEVDISDIEPIKNH